MRNRFVPVVLFAVSALSACKSDATAASAVHDGVVTPSEALDADCDHVQAASTEPMNGEAAFDLSSRCVFNREPHEVRLRILSETFQKVLDDGCNGRDSGWGHVIEMTVDGHRVPNVGIKVRGNTSRCNPKRQFKFKFDAKKQYSVWQGQTSTKEFPGNKDRRVFGLEGLSVRASQNDPSMVRERASSRVFNAASNLSRTTQRGGLVYRGAFAKLLVTFGRTEAEGAEGSFSRLIDGYWHDYKGLYTLAENVDETFLKMRFQVGDQPFAGFYLFQADLAQARFNRDAYSREGWKADFVDGEEPEDEQARANGDRLLFELFDLLADGGATDEQLGALIHVDSVLNYTAAAMLTGHWDSLLANRNNDFLFFDGRRWQIIAWDLDNSFGANAPLYEHLMSNAIFSPAKRNKSELFEVLLAESRPALRERLKTRLRGFLDGMYKEPDLNDMINWLAGTVQGATEGWERPDDGAFQALKDFGRARRERISPQL